MFENIVLFGAFGLFLVVLFGVGLVVLVAIVRAIRRPKVATSAPEPMALISGAPVDPISAFSSASDGHMQHAILSHIGNARAEKWKTDMASLLNPKPPAPPTPPNA